jgi:OmpR-family two-component system manganese-sensing sensor histidine kinase
LLLQQFQVIERLTRRLGRLVDDLLFLARQESGLIPLSMDTVDLDLLLAEVTEEQQVIAEERYIRLTYGTPVEAVNYGALTRASLLTPLQTKDTEMNLVGDGGQLSRLFTNLIGNAVQYTPNYGTVTVEAKPLKQQGHHWIQVIVKDTGIGMDADTLTHAFDRFYRADPARLRDGSKETGTGLGLAIAKVIVDNHRGHIQIDSQLDQGTTVTVLLPRTLGGATYDP